MAVPNVLLVANLLPIPTGTIGIALHDLCSTYPKGKLSLCAITKDTRFDCPPALDGMPHLLLPRPPEKGFKKLGDVFNKSARGVYERYVDRAYISDILKRIVEYGR